MDDTYRQIEGFPAYRVSRDGEVQTCWSRTVHKTRTENWRTLKPVRRGPYLTVNLGNGSKKKVARTIHRLVLEAFVGPRPAGCVCCHNDGNPTNNAVSNLRWDTYEANEHDKIRHGTKLTGTHFAAKLTEDEVVEIRRLRSDGVKIVDLADTFGVCHQNIGAIVHRRSWKDLP